MAILENGVPVILPQFQHKDDYILGYSMTLQPLSQINFSTIQTDKHLLSIAPTRSGKGRGLILPNLLNLPNHSVFVIDPKGENTLVSARYRQKQGHKVVIFNPYGIHADVFAERGFTQFQTFNPLENLDRTKPTFADDVAAVAEALIYQTHNDTHWTEAARGLVEFLIMYLVTEQSEERTFKRLRQIIASGPSGFLSEKEGKPSVLARASTSEFHLVSDNAGRYAGPSNEEINGVFATAEAQTRILKSETICSALSGEQFDFGRMKNEKISVYLILPSDRLITQARYLRLILLVAMSQFMRSEKGEHQVLMLLDEFANLGPLQVIENGYGLIAGHGVTLWSFVQNLTQLQNLYPKNWETFIANSAVVTVSDVNDVTTAEYFSRRAGKNLRSKISTTTGEGVTGDVMTG